MKTTISLLACGFLVAMFGNPVFTKANPLADLAQRAISTDQSVAQTAQEQLRAAGPEGLKALQQRFAAEISAHKNGAVADERWRRIGKALDKVGGQYDNYASGLYWYTDLDKAKAAAQASGRPILSLRLLGRLDEDLSCANSRFFRTTLYPSAQINQLLKDKFVLHWESVRPAPRVTINFGDGRKLERTITGNSIHYILDPNGNIVDALPGLYSATVFTSELRRAVDAVQQAHGKGQPDYTAHMNATEERLAKAWAADLKTVHVAVPQAASAKALEALMDDQKWQQVAQLHLNEVAFDPRVQEVMARKFPSAPKAAKVAVSKMAVESPMIAAFNNLSETVARDTVRNNYMLRTKILEFLVAPRKQVMSLAQVNDWVYAQVFLTPNQDPWLGLAAPDAFAAIDNNGQSR